MMQKPNKFAPKNKIDGGYQPKVQDKQPSHPPNEGTGVMGKQVQNMRIQQSNVPPMPEVVIMKVNDQEKSAIEKALYQDTLEAQAAMAAGEAKIPTWGNPFNEGATTYYEDQLVAARLRIEEVTKALKAANEDAEALYKALLSLHSPNNLDIREVMVTMDVVIQNHRRRIGK
jgi:hypothetical protein